MSLANYTACPRCGGSLDSGFNCNRCQWSRMAETRKRDACNAAFPLSASSDDERMVDEDRLETIRRTESTLRAPEVIDERRAYVMAMAILQSDLYRGGDDELRVSVDAAIERYARNWIGKSTVPTGREDAKNG